MTSASVKGEAGSTSTETQLPSSSPPASFQGGLGEVEHEISSQALAQAELLKSEKRLRAISDVVQDAMVVLDDVGRIVFWNKAASRIFGYTVEEALGQAAHLLLAPARYHEAYQAGWPRFAKEGRGPVVGKELELEARRKDGAEFLIKLSVSPLKFNERWEAVGVMRDITDLKQAESQRQEHLKFLESMDCVNRAIHVCIGAAG